MLQGSPQSHLILSTCPCRLWPGSSPGFCGLKATPVPGVGSGSVSFPRLFQSLQHSSPALSARLRALPSSRWVVLAVPSSPIPAQLPLPRRTASDPSEGATNPLPQRPPRSQGLGSAAVDLCPLKFPGVCAHHRALSFPRSRQRLAGMGSRTPWCPSAWHPPTQGGSRGPMQPQRGVTSGQNSRRCAVSAQGPCGYQGPGGRG